MKNILKTIEPYYIIISSMFLGFFIVLTGVTILPDIVSVASDGSYAPFVYSLSILSGIVYFFCYKPFKIIISDEGEQVSKAKKRGKKK